MKQVVIDRRFCGPKNSGNGGYSAGLFAQAIDGPAAVMLMAPPPLDAPIDLRPASDGEGWEAVHKDKTIARMAPANPDVEPPAPPSEADVAAAHDAYLAEEAETNIFPYCFVCGPKRAHGDGLRIFSGAAPASPMNADFWTPGEDLGDEDGLVRPEFLWAALDCPSYFGLRVLPTLSLLGRLEAKIMRRPRVGERLIVAGWPRGQDGRKRFASSAVYGEDRQPIAAANAVWIEVNDPDFLNKLRTENEQTHPPV